MTGGRTTRPTLASAIAAMATAAAFSTGAWAAGPVPLVEAEAFQAELEAGTLAVAIPPIDYLGYVGPKVVDQTRSLGIVTRSAPVLGGYPAVLTMTGQTMVSGVATALPGANPNDAAQATVQTVTATLGNQNLGTKTPAVEIVVNGVVVGASETDVAGSQGTARTFQGSTSFGGLTLGGYLIGRTITLATSQPAPNTVLFQSAYVTVTLNRQQALSGPTCTYAPSRCYEAVGGLLVTGVDILLVHAPVNGGSADDDTRIGVSGSAAVTPIANAR